jgi:predicted transposase/invertase (TIGR01784 family)
MHKWDAPFQSELEQYEQEKKMPYITSIEQMGHQKGREAEKEAIALNLLRENISLEIIARTTGLSLEQLEQLQNQIPLEEDNALHHFD